jgi:hypothetical protein
MATQVLALIVPAPLLAQGYPLLGELVWAFRRRDLVVEQRTISVLGLKQAADHDEQTLVQLSGTAEVLADAVRWFQAQGVQVTEKTDAAPLVDAEDVAELLLEIVRAGCARLGLPALGELIQTAVIAEGPDLAPAVAELVALVRRLDQAGLADRVFPPPRRPV